MTTHGPIDIRTFPLGVYQTNCYLVRPAAGGGAGIVVDCGMEARALIDAMDNTEAIVLTHAHVDHIAGLHDARKRYPKTPIWIHTIEEHWLLDAELNLSAFGQFPTTAPPADRLLEHGETLRLAGVDWDVLHVPGHSPGSIAFYSAAARVVIAGDALFAGSVGRTDFPGCSMETLAQSIREHLYTLPDETIVYPGHGPATTIGRERATNPYVRDEASD